MQAGTAQGHFLGEQVHGERLAGEVLADDARQFVQPLPGVAAHIVFLVLESGPRREVAEGPFPVFEQALHRRLDVTQREGFFDIDVGPVFQSLDLRVHGVYHRE